MFEKILPGLEIMGKGMAGIFIAIIVIMLAVMLMNRLSGRNRKNNEEA